MRRLSLSLALSLSSLSCHAGYSEYHFLAPSVCESFLISSDTTAPDPNSPQAGADYKAYVSAKRSERPWIWALYVARDAPVRWADCQETGKEIACTVIGPFRYSSFTCPLGQSNQWSRTCTTVGGKPGELKVYSVDTSEYEEGGKPVVNQYLLADQKRFNAQCKKETGRQPR